MAIESTPGITAAANARLGLDELLRVMLTELTNQDPFKPVENKDFMSQIAQFASLDTAQQMNENILQLLALQALTNTVGLIGRQVSAVNGEGVINGRVTAVTLNDGAPRLTIEANGRTFVDIPIGALQNVRP